MKYNLYYTHKSDPDGAQTAYRTDCDRKSMLVNRKYLIKSGVIPKVFLGEVEIEVTDDDK